MQSAGSAYYQRISCDGSVFRKVSPVTIILGRQSRR
jgi:hypothetical protein